MDEESGTCARETTTARLELGDRCHHSGPWTRRRLLCDFQGISVIHPFASVGESSAKNLDDPPQGMTPTLENRKLDAVERPLTGVRTLVGPTRSDL